MKQLKPLLRTPTWHRGFVTVSSQASRARQAGLKAAAALPVHGLQRAVERESWLITSHHITSYHIISYQIRSSHINIKSHHITSYCVVLNVMLCCRTGVLVPGKNVMPVSVEKNTPPEKRTLGNVGLQKVKSWAGTQFSPLGCIAKACTKGMFFHRHQ